MSDLLSLLNIASADTSSSPILKTVADVCGWLYLFIWGSYMYPQVYLNYKLRSVEGFKLDFPFLNLSGFIFLSISNSVGYFYQLPFHNYGLGNVKIQDLLYSLNGSFVCIILALQAIFYKRGENRITLFSFFFSLMAWVSSLLLYILSEVYDVIQPSQSFNIIIYMGDLKVAVNMVKYLPLIYFNFKRKDTEGISIIAFVLNLVGASFSLVQMALDYICGTTDTINPVKTGLAMATMFYDVILISQYFTYKNKKYNKLQDSTNLNSPDFYSLNSSLTNDDEYKY